MMFVLQNEEMKTKGEILIKFTKNRYTGMTDSFIMNVDYQKMRFMDIDGDFKTLEQKNESEKIVNDFKTNIINNDTQIVKENQKRLSIEDIMELL